MGIKVLTEMDVVKIRVKMLNLITNLQGVHSTANLLKGEEGNVLRALVKSSFAEIEEVTTMLPTDDDIRVAEYTEKIKNLK